jgi:hypothetical protein
MYLSTILTSYISVEIVYVTSYTYAVRKTVLISSLKKMFKFPQSLRTFPVIVNNNYSRISGKMSFTIEDITLIINNY